METYRSGHNGADSKSVREQSHVGSNPTVSANRTLENIKFSRVLLFMSPVKMRFQSKWCPIALRLPYLFAVMPVKLCPGICPIG